MTRRKDHYFWVLVWKKNYIHEKTHWRIFLFHSSSLETVFIQCYIFSSQWSIFISYECNSNPYLIQIYTRFMRRVRCIHISDKIFGPNFTNLICYECIQIYIILNTLCKILRQSDKTLVSRMDYYLLFSISFHIKTIVYYICERKKKKKECNMNIYPAHYLLKININV